MALQAPTLASAMTRLTTGTGLASASYTPATNDFLVAVAYVHTSGATLFTDTATCAGNGQTWTKRRGTLSADGKQYLCMFTAGPVASPSAGATTITVNTSVTEAFVAVYKFAAAAPTGPDTTTPYVTSGGGANASGASFSASGITALSDQTNGRLMVVGHKAAEVTTPRTGWTELGDSQTSPATGTAIALEGQYLLGSDESTVSASWASSVVSIYGYIEVKNLKALSVGGAVNSYDDNTDTSVTAGNATSGWNAADGFAAVFWTGIALDTSGSQGTDPGYDEKPPVTWGTV
jgi:hypothetical protein